MCSYSIKAVTMTRDGVNVDTHLLGEYLKAARAAAEEFSLRDDVGLSARLDCLTLPR